MDCFYADGTRNTNVYGDCVMSIIWQDSDVLKMTVTFGVNCLYFQARKAPDQNYGQTKLESDAIHGFRYDSPESVKLMRSAISQKIALSEHGRMYQGGATFTIPPVAMVSGVLVTPKVYERIFIGDVIVVREKAIRDWDVLRKGKRDQIFAFDVKTILSVSSIDGAGVEQVYLYGRDYTIQIDGVAVTATKRTGENVWDITPAATQPITSMLNIVWNTAAIDGVTPIVPDPESYYTVEFLCSPNYVVMPLGDKDRATEDNNLPKTIQCVKRAWFNETKPLLDTVDTRQTIDNSDRKIYD